MATSTPPYPVLAADIDAVRRFNRFHTRLVGALGAKVLDSDLALPQVRVIYELAHAGRAPTAGELASRLGLDPGYLSRLLAGLETRALVQRQSPADDRRRRVLALTAEGRALFKRLNEASASEVRALLAALPPADQAALVGALTRARRLLGDGEAAGAIVLRDPAPGDLGWVVHRQALLYAREYGWDNSFEALVAEIVARFVRDFKPGRERCWIAEAEGQVVGSVFVVQEDEVTARLRLLYVDAAARGHGLGRRLVDECLRFARDAGYRRMLLWTNDVLAAARRIYEATGFELVESTPHHSFGKDLVGQVWSREL